MENQTAALSGDPARDLVLQRTLAIAGLPASGRYIAKGGWASRAWVGDEFVVRLSNGEARDAFGHEARVVALLAGTDVPHARHIAHGAGPDGPWYISERLRGQTLHDAWPDADARTRQTLIESLGAAIRALHRVPVAASLLPPWLADALNGGPWPAFHPPVVSGAVQRVEAARLLPKNDSRLLDDVAIWIHDRLPLFMADDQVLVHGDLHGSNVMVDQGHITGLVDFAEAVAQPADAELDTILRWCARPGEFPPRPGGRGLDRCTLGPIPGWLHGAYPELFNRERLRERLNFFDMCVELAIYAHHPDIGERTDAQARITLLLSGNNHLDGLVW